ncbi:hypothetical protein INR49_002334 [Caranx melampygus]|nr:hypothetical protein INR49_002334 [Caranx melampygus]
MVRRRFILTFSSSVILTDKHFLSSRDLGKMAPVNSWRLDDAAGSDSLTVDMLQDLRVGLVFGGMAAQRALRRKRMNWLGGGTTQNGVIVEATP